MNPINVFVIAALSTPSGVPAAPGHSYHREQHENAPAEMWVVIEVPLGHVYVDRFQSMPVVAPANYGSLPRTLAVDGDPLDAVLVSRHSIHPGAFLRVRPAGVIRTIDGEHKDDKILVVPVSQVDSTYDAVRDVGDLPEAERARIAAYFRVYKQLPTGLEGRILETSGREVAERLIRESMEFYRKAHPPSR